MSASAPPPPPYGPVDPPADPLAVAPPPYGPPAQGGPPPISPAGGLPAVPHTGAADATGTAAAGPPGAGAAGAAGIGAAARADAADQTRTGHRAAPRTSHRGPRTTTRSGGRPRGTPPLPLALNPRHPKRRRRAARGLAVLAAMVSLTLFVVSMAGWATVKRADGKITRVVIKHVSKQPPPAPPGTVNYLLVGADNRPGLDGKRSDTIMLAHLDKNGSTVLVSFPRDTFVAIPGHGHNKINAAMSFGGPSLLIDTLADLTKIRIDHYISIDFNGFKTMADAVGGVNVCVSRVPSSLSRVDNLVDINSGFRGHYGVNKVSGDQALGYDRARDSLPYGDIDRIRRQQNFLAQLFKQATTSSVMLNPARELKLIDALSGSLELDSGTSNRDLLKLAQRLRGVATGAVQFKTVPTHTPTRAEGALDDFGRIGSYGDVQFYKQADVDALFAPLRADAGTTKATPGPATQSPAPTPSTTTPTPTPTVTVPPSQVNVEVLNGTRRQGLAATAAASLRARGFAVTGTGNATNRAQTASEVRYGPTRKGSATTLAGFVPGAALVADPTLGSTVELVLGSSFTGVGSTATPAGLDSDTTTVQAAADIVPAAPAAPGTIEAPANCPY